LISELKKSSKTRDDTEKVGTAQANKPPIAQAIMKKVRMYGCNLYLGGITN
jgi:hypothetical protein